MKKCWCQQNSEGVSRDSYTFWIFSRQRITVLSFVIVGYVSQIFGRGGLFGAPKMSILNRVKGATESYFTHYFCVVTVLFNTALCRSVLSTVSFKTSFFFLCLLWIKTLKYASSCYLILICNFVLTLYIKTHLLL